MIDFKSESIKAGISAAHSLTQNLQESASAHGWAPHLVRGLSVKFTGKDFNVTYPDELHQDIHVLEYGTETARPTAVIRKFKNRQSHIDNTFATHLSKHMGGKL